MNIERRDEPSGPLNDFPNGTGSMERSASQRLMLPSIPDSKLWTSDSNSSAEIASIVQGGVTIVTGSSTPQKNLHTSMHTLTHFKTSPLHCVSSAWKFYPTSSSTISTDLKYERLISKYGGSADSNQLQNNFNKNVQYLGRRSRLTWCHHTSSVPYTELSSKKLIVTILRQQHHLLLHLPQMKMTAFSRSKTIVSKWYLTWRFLHTRGTNTPTPFTRSISSTKLPFKKRTVTISDSHYIVFSSKKFAEMKTNNVRKVTHIETKRLTGAASRK